MTCVGSVSAVLPGRRSKAVPYLKVIVHFRDVAGV
jgi:hypothetical protein